MDTRTDHRCALAGRCQCPWHECTVRREHNGDIQWNRRHGIGISGPGGAQRTREGLRPQLPAAREGNISFLCARHLGKDMCGSAKSI
jgi:hypothetical protein